MTAEIYRQEYVWQAVEPSARGGELALKATGDYTGLGSGLGRWGTMNDPTLGEVRRDKSPR